MFGELIDLKFMDAAIIEAKKAFSDNEVPVGCVIVHNGQIIAQSHNTTEKESDATCHAEINAIKEAEKFLKQKVLNECDMYVTLEPCPMCTGAIINSRIKRVVFGAKDSVAGCCGSVVNLNFYPFTHSFELEGGLCAEESLAILKSFFEERRGKNEPKN